MKVVFSGTPNPKMITITEYIEKAIKKNGHDVVFFNNRAYKIPGKLRERVNWLERYDLENINNELIAKIKKEKPDFFLETGGMRILPKTINKIRALGVQTVLWTIDAPQNLRHNFLPIMESAPHYDFVFTAGTEAYDILKSIGVERLFWLPFACDPDFHYPVQLTPEEIQEYGYDVVSVASIHQDLYPNRLATLASLVEYKLGVWGPGGEDVATDSPLKPYIKGSNASYELWTKIYSASKIILSQHYHPAPGLLPCHQASPRVYEIMACGGFQVVDNQPDVLRLFTDKEQLVVFNDNAHLKKIIQYYLAHDDERFEIAKRGYEVVIKRHTYRHRINEMVDIIKNKG